MARSNTGSSSNTYTQATPGVATRPLTIACWLNPANLTSNNNLVFLGDNADVTYEGLIFDGANANGQGDNVVLAVSGAGGGESFGVSATGGTAGTWMHCAAVFASDTSRQAFLNGVGGSVNATSRSPTNERTFIGSYRTFGNINGSMAEVAIWNVALTAAEVASLADGASPLLIRPNNLVRYYPLLGIDTETCRISGEVLTPVGGGLAKAAHVPRMINPRLPIIGVPGTAPTAYSLPAAAGAYTLTGTDATLNKLGNKTIAAAAGAYALTGTAATMTSLRAMDATARAYDLPGTAATLTKTGTAVGTLPVFRSVSSTGYALRAAVTLCSAPVGVANGDILVAGMFVARGGASLADANFIGISPPAGWTQVGTATKVFSGSLCGTYWVFWKRASSEGADYIFVHTPQLGDTVDTYSTQLVISAYSGSVGSGNPIDVFSQNSADTGSPAVANAIVTTALNSKLIYTGHNWEGAGLVPPTGMTERFDNVAYLSDEDWPALGSTGARNQTLSSSIAPWAAFLLALKPGGALTAYSITVEAGSYALTGTAATLAKVSVSERHLLASSGSYGLTGTLATLTKIGTSTPPVYRSHAITGYGPRVGETTCTAPAGVANDDILIASMFAGRAGASIADADLIIITPPAGWTQVGTQRKMYSDGFCATFWTYWKRASGEPANYTFSHVDGFTQLAIAAYSGSILLGNPIDVFSQNSANSGSPATATPIVTTTSSTKLIYTGSNWEGSGLTPPFGMTERFDGLVYLADETMVAAGTTGARTQTSSAPWSAVLLALLPALPEISTSTYNVKAKSGSYNLTGTTVSSGRGLIALAGSYSLTGRPVVLGGRLDILASSGSYVLTGTPAALVAPGVVPPGGLSGMNVWTGSAWVNKPVKVWTGSAWVNKPVKVWNGSSWV